MKKEKGDLKIFDDNLGALDITLVTIAFGSVVLFFGIVFVGAFDLLHFHPSMVLRTFSFEMVLFLIAFGATLILMIRNPSKSLDKDRSGESDVEA